MRYRTIWAFACDPLGSTSVAMESGIRGSNLGDKKSVRMAYTAIRHELAESQASSEIVAR